MPFEVGFVIAGCILLVFANYLVQRFNNKRREFQAIAFYLQLVSVGMNEEDASAYVVYKMKLSENEIKKVLARGRELEEEAIRIKIGSDATQKIFEKDVASGIAKGREEENRYNIDKWETEGTDFYSLLTEDSPMAMSFIEHLIRLEIEKSYKDASIAEVCVIRIVLLGFLVSTENRTNSFMTSLLHHIIREGRRTANRQDDLEKLSGYLKRIHNYILVYSTEKKEREWTALTTPKHLLENIEGELFWVIAVKCLDIVRE